MLRVIVRGAPSLTQVALFPDDHVALIDPRLELYASTLHQYLRRLPESLSDTPTIVLRAGAAAGITIPSASAAAAQILRDHSVFVLAPDAGGRLALSHQPWSRAAGIPPSLMELRAGEVSSLLSRGGAMTSQNSVHYLAPSGLEHIERFIRLADALNDNVGLERLCDWLLEYVDASSAIAVDHGSILGLAHRVAAVANRLWGVNIPIASLSEYPSAAGEFAQDLRTFAAAVAPRRLVAFVSVNSSGGLVNQLKSILPECRIVVIVHAGASSWDIELPSVDGVFVSLGARRWRVGHDGKCEQCRDGGRRLVIINPRTYTANPRLPLEGRPYSQGYSSELIAQSRSFWEAVDRTESVALHTDLGGEAGGRGIVRHHPISIDIRNLLRDQAFRNVCQVRLSEVVGNDRPDVAIVPMHRNTDVVGELVRAVWPTVNLAVATLGHAALGSLVPRAARSVVVVDDSSITGETFLRIHRELQRLCDERGQALRIAGFVVIARPGSSRDLGIVRARFQEADGTGFRSAFAHGADVLLPLPSRDSCGWCAEESVLQALASRVGGKRARGVLSHRLGVLGAAGLSAPGLFPGVAAREAERLGARRIQNAIFGQGLRPLTITAQAISHAMQLRELLSDKRDLGEDGWFALERVLPAVREPMLIGALLRTMDRTALFEASRRIPLERAIRDLRRGGIDPGLAWELALAAGRSRLPRNPVQELFEVFPARSGLRAVLEELCVGAGVSYLARDEDPRTGRYRRGAA